MAPVICGLHVWQGCANDPRVREVVVVLAFDATGTAAIDEAAMTRAQRLREADALLCAAKHWQWFESRCTNCCDIPITQAMQIVMAKHAMDSGGSPRLVG